MKFRIHRFYVISLPIILLSSRMNHLVGDLTIALITTITIIMFPKFILGIKLEKKEEIDAKDKSINKILFILLSFTYVSILTLCFYVVLTCISCSYFFRTISIVYLLTYFSVMIYLSVKGYFLN